MFLQTALLCVISRCKRAACTKVTLPPTARQLEHLAHLDGALLASLNANLLRATAPPEALLDACDARGILVRGVCGGTPGPSWGGWKTILHTIAGV
jgi:hypothetical protein